MTYCTQSDLEDLCGESELVQLSNPDNPGATTIDAAQIAWAINAAEARMNRYIGPFLPLSNVPADFKQIACDFARYLLYRNSPTEHVRQQYEDGIAYLEKVAARKIPIGPDAAGVSAEPEDTGVAVIAQPSVFSGIDF